MEKIALEQQQQIWFSSKASKELKSLKRVFKKLLSVHRAYILGEAAEDYPYRYKERPHVGLLAAAVWLSGGKALEEYRASKNKKGKDKVGRCDLWIRTNRAAFECEAKRHWLNLGLKKDTEGLKQITCKKLHLAVEDVESLENKKGLALCFTMPSIHNKSKKRDTLDKLIRDLIESLKNDFLCDALIWIGFKKGQKPMGENYLQADNYLHPGLLLAIKEVKKKGRRRVAP